MRHRFAVTNWLTAAYRTVQLVGRQAVHLGGALPAQGLDRRGRRDRHQRHLQPRPGHGRLGAVLRRDRVVPAGRGDPAAARRSRSACWCCIGVPVLMLLIGPLLRPLDRRSAHQRHLMGELSNTASDIVGGLRVLRGIGGEQVFHDRYRRESQTTRQAGVQVARLQSVLDALQVFLPGVFVVIVVWLGARYAVQGRITPRRAGRVLRLLGVPDDPAADRDRVRQQADPRPGLGRAGSAGCWRSTPDHLDPATRPPPPPPGRRAGRRPHRAPGPARAGDRAGQRPARRGRRARGPARALRGRGRRRRHPGRRTAHRAAPRRRTPPDRRLRHRRDAVLGPARRPSSTPPAAPATCAARSRPRRPTTSSRRCPTGWTPWWPSAAGRSPAVSGSGWSWPARWPATRRSWCWSSRPPRSTPTPRPGSRRGCAATGPGRTTVVVIVQPAGARRGRRGGLPARRPRRRDRHPRRRCSSTTPTTAPW